MTKPIVTATIDSGVFSCYGKIEQVEIRRSKAAYGHCVAQFYAPGWRPMAFKTIEAARAKMERHPGFQGWVA